MIYSCNGPFLERFGATRRLPRRTYDEDPLGRGRSGWLSRHPVRPGNRPRHVQGELVFKQPSSNCAVVGNNVQCLIQPDGISDGTVRITNVGTSGGSLCADIYVFDPYQELAECCSCKITPDGLLTLSVSDNLTANTLTGVPLSSGVVKIVSSSTCDATARSRLRGFAPGELTSSWA